MASASRFSMSYRRMWAICALAGLMAAVSVSDAGRTQAGPLAPNSPVVSVAPMMTLEFHPGDSGLLYHDIKLRISFRRFGRVVRRIGRGVGEVLGGTIKATGEIIDTTRKVAQIPGEVGSKVGSEVGGFVGGLVGGRKGRRAGRKVGRLAGTYYGGKIGGRSSLIRTVNRAGAKAEHIQEVAQKWQDHRRRIRAIFRGDPGALIGELPGVIQERTGGGGDLLDRLTPRVPTGGPRPTPTPRPPTRIEGRG